MKFVEAGTGADGRSTVIRRLDIGSVVSTGLWEDRLPPRLPDAITELANVDLGVPAGAAQWRVLNAPPGFEAGMHRTDTVDLDTILAGSCEIVLDDGAELLEAGDMVLVNGANHAWRAGPEGFTIAAVLIGTPAAGR